MDSNRLPYPRKTLIKNGSARFRFFVILQYPKWI